MNTKFEFFVLIFVLWSISGSTASSSNCNFKEYYLTECCRFLRVNRDHKGCYDSLADSKEHTNKELWCALECFMTAHLGYKNYTFDPQEVEKYFNRIYSVRQESEMLMKIKKIFNYCEKKVKPMSAVYDLDKYESAKCSIYPFLVMHCMAYHSFVHCPKTELNPTKTCKDSVNHMKWCSFNGTLGSLVDSEGYLQAKSYSIDITPN